MLMIRGTPTLEPRIRLCREVFLEHLVDLEQFLFKGLQGLIIQPELELESTVRHAPTALEQGNHLVEDLFKIHS
jgi:hypothetical protein